MEISHYLTTLPLKAVRTSTVQYVYASRNNQYLNCTPFSFLFICLHTICMRMALPARLSARSVVPLRISALPSLPRGHSIYHTLSRAVCLPIPLPALHICRLYYRSHIDISAPSRTPGRTECQLIHTHTHTHTQPLSFRISIVFGTSMPTPEIKARPRYEANSAKSFVNN